jgi:hypothetical protein
MGYVVLVVLGVIAYWAGWFDSFKAYTYRAEVGYYVGDRQNWYVGNDKSRDDCQSEAIAIYNNYNREKPGRAFSWACRKMKGEQFLERVR